VLYDFQIYYRKGTLNPADVSSRLGVLGAINKDIVTDLNISTNTDEELLM